MFKGLLSKLSAGLNDQLKAFVKDETFLRASMAVCALVAAADGEIEQAEKQKIRIFIGRNADLKLFGSVKCLAVFEEFTTELEFDFKMGQDVAFKAIDTLVAGKDPTAVNTMLRLAVAIANADGELEDAEVKVILEVIQRAGANAADYLPADAIKLAA